MDQDNEIILGKMEKLEEHMMKIERNQKELQTDFADLLSCKDDLQTSVDKLSIIVNGDEHDQDNPGLRVIVLGSARLGVRPLREVMNELAKTDDRLRWLWGIIGVIVIALAITWLGSLIGG